MTGVLMLACLLATIGAPAWGSVCDSTSKGFVPLMDLGTGTYKGQQGGLYPDGTNVPPAPHLAAGLGQANAIAPLDTLGAPDSTGWIALISIGMSNTTQEFQAFIPLANALPTKNPRVRVIDGAQGGQTAHVFANPSAPAWDVIDTRLRNAGLSPKQVQVIWLKEANAGPTQAFPVHAESLRNDLRNVVRNVRARYENARICYLSSRIYAGYASTALNPEPYAYESAFSIRWLIEEQLAGNADLNFDPDAGPVVAPWLAWGPYLWADGIVPRSDGLTYVCSDFANDGTHPAAGARSKVANLLLDFLRSDPTATPWFIVESTAVKPSPIGRMVRVLPAHPNPFSDRVSFAVELAETRDVRVDVVTPDGRRLRRLANTELGPGRWNFQWDGADERGVAMGPGVYFLRVSPGEEQPVTERVLLVR